MLRAVVTTNKAEDAVDGSYSKLFHST